MSTIDVFTPSDPVATFGGVAASRSGWKLGQDGAEDGDEAVNLLDGVVVDQRNPDDAVVLRQTEVVD